MDQRGIYAITIRFLPWGGSFRDCLDFRAIWWKAIRLGANRLRFGFDLEYGWPQHQSVFRALRVRTILLHVQFFYRAKS